MTTKSNGNPPPAYRIFISSTYEDMKEFRSAAADALTNIQAIPMGMERFVAANQPVIDRCYEEIRQCQYFVSILGFRYGSLYKDTNLSYSELEFDEAERLGIPILTFIREGTIDANRIDMDDFSRRNRFKKKLQGSASNRITVNFTSPEDLRDKLTRALQEEFKRSAESKETNASSKKENKVSSKEEYLVGAATYRNFLLMPGEYRDQTVKLRVRFDGTFGSWLLKEELFEAYNLPIGRALYLQDLFVLGADYSDLGDEAKHIDAFAVGDAAKWILENNITRGSVFEAYFRLEWKYVKNVAGKSRLQFGASSAYIAKLILRDTHIELITQNSNTAMPNQNLSELSSLVATNAGLSMAEDRRFSNLSQESIYELLQKLLQ